MKIIACIPALLLCAACAAPPVVVVVPKSPSIVQSVQPVTIPVSAPVPLSAHAEPKWVAYAGVRGVVGSSEKFEYDAASISPLTLETSQVNSTPIEVVIRRYRDMPGFPLSASLSKSRVQLFCKDFGMNYLAIESRDINMGGKVDMPPQGNGSDQPKRPENLFRWDSQEGGLIIAVCGAVNPSWKPSYLEAYEQLCKGDTSESCSPSRRTSTITVMQLSARGAEAAAGCAALDPNTDREVYKKLLTSAVRRALTPAPDCDSEGCFQLRISEQMRSFEKNQLLAAKGGPCTLLADSQKFAQEAAQEDRKEAQSQAGKDALLAYFACAAAKTPSLDDRVSSAQDIATGLHSACFSDFTRSADLLGITAGGRANYAAQVRPKLIEFVLQYRAMSKSAPAPSPRTPASKPKQIDL